MPLYKQNQIGKVDISLKQLSDLDTTNALYSDRLDNIRDNQILISGTNQYRKDVFRFKYLTDLIQAGTGVTITSSNGVLTISSTGGGGGSGTVTSIDVDGGTGISVSPAGPITTSGTFTVTNTAPDQTVVLNNGAGISVTGTYPNFTITNTGSTPSLQQVTAVGYETTDAIITKNVFGFQVKTSLNQLLAMLHPNGANTEGELILYNINTLLPATTYKRAGINNMLFPTSGSGTFALSVNGVTPNATTGDITLSVGGGGLKYGAATQVSAGVYTTIITGATTPLTAGDVFMIKFDTVNDGASTLNINGSGAVNIYKNTSTPISSGDIKANQTVEVVYDGTNFQAIGLVSDQLLAYVHNAEGAVISKGQVVYAHQASGNKMSVKLAKADQDSTSAKTIGLVYDSSIGIGGEGYIIIQGVIEGVNTSAFSAGDTLYLSGTTYGGVTATKPSAPTHLVYVGIVERANAGNGQIYVRCQNGYELDEIHDVDLVTTPPVNNDVLTYVTGSPDLWKPRSLASILGYTPIGGTGTINEIAYFAGSTTIGSLTTATYPSLTELSYVKGLTSSAQTQINNLKVATIGVSIDGSGGTITVGQKGYVQVPYACTITSWRIIANTSGSVVIDIWKTAAPSIPTAGGTITGSAKPTLTTQQTNASSTLTGWTTTINANDIIGFNVDSASVVSFVTLQIFVTKT